MKKKVLTATAAVMAVCLLAAGPLWSYFSKKITLDPGTASIASLGLTAVKDNETRKTEMPDALAPGGYFPYDYTIKKTGNMMIDVAEVTDVTIKIPDGNSSTFTTDDGNLIRLITKDTYGTASEEEFGTGNAENTDKKLAVTDKEIHIVYLKKNLTGYFPETAAHSDGTIPTGELSRIYNAALGTAAKSNFQNLVVNINTTIYGAQHNANNTIAIDLTNDSMVAFTGEWSSASFNAKSAGTNGNSGNTSSGVEIEVPSDVPDTADTSAFYANLTKVDDTHTGPAETTSITIHGNEICEAEYDSDESTVSSTDFLKWYGVYDDNSAIYYSESEWDDGQAAAEGCAKAYYDNFGLFIEDLDKALNDTKSYHALLTSPFSGLIDCPDAKHVYAGLYSEATGGTRITKDNYADYLGKDVYVHWSDNPYHATATVTYNLDGNTTAVTLNYDTALCVTNRVLLQMFARPLWMSKWHGMTFNKSGYKVTGYTSDDSNLSAVNITGASSDGTPTGAGVRPTTYTYKDTEYTYGKKPVPSFNASILDGKTFTVVYEYVGGSNTPTEAGPQKLMTKVFAKNNISADTVKTMSGVTFARSSTAPANGTAVVDMSSDGSGSAVAWLDGNEVKWYSTADKVAVNDASEMFCLTFNDMPMYTDGDAEKNYGDCITSVDLTGLDFTNCTATSDMFTGCGSITSLDTSALGTLANDTNMNAMFQMCSSLQNLDVSNFNTTNVADMGSMFEGCASLTTLNLGNFDPSNVTNMSKMFCNDSGLTTLTLSNFNTANATDMSNMFYNCVGLETLDVSKFSTAKVSNFSNMFNSMSSLKTLDLSNFDTSSATLMYRMFQNCRNLTDVNLTSFNTSTVTDISNMFRYDDSLTTIDVSSFDTSNVKWANGMFTNCSGLTTIKASDKFVNNSDDNWGKMFSGCSSLVGGSGTKYDGVYDESTKRWSGHVDGEYARIDKAGTPGYFTAA